MEKIIKHANLSQLRVCLHKICKVAPTPTLLGSFLYPRSNVNAL